jgi:hypothetical protein
MPVCLYDNMVGYSRLSNEHIHRRVDNGSLHSTCRQVHHHPLLPSTGEHASKKMVVCGMPNDYQVYHRCVARNWALEHQSIHTEANPKSLLDVTNPTVYFPFCIFWVRRHLKCRTRSSFQRHPACRTRSPWRLRRRGSTACHV